MVDSIEQDLYIGDTIVVVPKSGSAFKGTIVGFTKIGTPRLDVRKIYSGQQYFKIYEQ